MRRGRRRRNRLRGSSLNKHVVRMLLGLAVVAVFLLHGARAVRFDVIDRLEAFAYDVRLLVTMPRTVDPRIVIVDIDEKSLAEEGHWPWRRDRVADLVGALVDRYGVRVVGFDVVFAERDQSSGLGVLRQLAETELKDNAGYQGALQTLAPRLEFDRIFAERIRGRPVVLGYYFTQTVGLDIGALPPPVLPAGTFKGRNIAFVQFPGYGGNLPELQTAAAGAGHFTPWTDVDGVHRAVPMLAEYKGAYYEPLALAVVRLLLDSPQVKPGYPSEALFNRNYPGLEWLEAGPLRIPVDERVNALVPYRGGHHSFPYVSASDVLHERVPPETLKDRIVLVGTTAPGLQDLRSTPVGTVYPGVEIHANLIAGMLDGTIKQKPPYVLGAEVVLLAVAGVLLAVCFAFLTPLRATVLTLAVLGGVFGLNLLVWSQGNLVLPMASGLLMVVLLYAFNMTYGYFVETLAKRQISDRFGQYVPPELVDEMSRHPERFSMESEAREMTVLFTDVRGFTTISESLEPQILQRLMNEYLTPMTRVIHGHRGTIDKYMGDAIMAFWGAPITDADHARNAVLAGLDMLKALEPLNAEFRGKGWPPLSIGVGVNSGPMTVGNMGSEVRVAYTVMGDTVNLASRLEGLSKKYRVGMIVGEATKALVPDVVFIELDRVRVKGKDAPVAIFEPLGLQSEVPKDRLDQIKLHQQALKFYRARDWDKAELQWINLQRADPGRGLYIAYLERIAELRGKDLPSGWDGVYDFESK
ncbi:MAG: adenylate/guanylate cyclase domain-containing protein [Burkholderiales bacterium]|nr:adenylate/guanylate cyclase domain-containing protein [Burkholderiales bacterium]